MKPGLQIGNQAVIRAVVSPEMFAQFEGEVIHPVYSTVTMIYHMEWASRLLITPIWMRKKKGWVELFLPGIYLRHLKDPPLL